LSQTEYDFFGFAEVKQQRLKLLKTFKFNVVRKIKMQERFLLARRTGAFPSSRANGGEAAASACTPGIRNKAGRPLALIMCSTV